MKRQWTIDELIDQFTLLPKEQDLLTNKTGATRLGFAILLKYFQAEGRFPRGKHDVPKAVVDYIAHQLTLSPDLWQGYDWAGRSSTDHRAQIRAFCQFREAAVADEAAMTDWLITNTLPSEPDLDQLTTAVLAPSYATCHQGQSKLYIGDVNGEHDKTRSSICRRKRLF